MKIVVVCFSHFGKKEEFKAHTRESRKLSQNAKKVLTVVAIQNFGSRNLGQNLTLGCS